MTPGQYFSEDISDLLGLLARHDVRYLIVGGEAVIYYGHARLTGDIDIYYDISEKNTERLFVALQEFWGGVVPSVGSPEELRSAGMIFQFGLPPNRIDLISQMEGVDFARAWDRKANETMTISGSSFPIYYIGLEDLISNKKKADRARDKDDVKFLTKALEQKRRDVKT